MSMRLYRSGRVVDPMNLRSRDLDIRDIAHNLSMICRFAGAFPFHYSVGQHSLMVCDHMRAEGHNKEACLAGLLHDAAEYLFNDLISSVKHHPVMEGYRTLEHETSRMILATYGCNPDLLTIVKPYDTLVYQIEDEVRKGNRALIQPLQPHVVYTDFLQVFHSLYNCPLLSMVRR